MTKKTEKVPQEICVDLTGVVFYESYDEWLTATINKVFEENLDSKKQESKFEMFKFKPLFNSISRRIRTLWQM